MRTRIALGAFFLFLAAPILADGQTAAELGLVLTGQVESCGSSERRNTEKACYKVRMVFRNTGKEPVIIINPTLGYGTGLRKATFYFKYSEPDEVSCEGREVTTEETNSIDARWAEDHNFTSMAQLLDGPRPAENMTVTLQPNETFAFEDGFEVKLQYRHRKVGCIIKRDRVTHEIIGVSSATTGKVSADSFRLTYEFSFLPHLLDPDFLEHLSMRWRRYGRLPVDVNGTYTITSEALPEVNSWRIRQ